MLFSYGIRPKYSSNPTQTISLEGIRFVVYSSGGLPTFTSVLGDHRLQKRATLTVCTAYGGLNCPCTPVCAVNVITV